MPKEEKALVEVRANIATKGIKGMEEYLKPLSKDIFLFSTKIAGTYRIKDKSGLHGLKVDDRLEFLLGESKYADDEIRIVSQAGVLLGYVPEEDSPVFARLMEAGKMLYARVKTIAFTHATPLIDIDIYLTDF